MLDKLKTFITQHKLIAKSDKIALAISGGKDSVFAAHILDEMEQPFVMVHVNFNLRGDESIGDALFVRNLSAKLEYCTGVFVKNVDTAEYAKEQKINTQLAAREIRYDYFDELKEQGAYTKLITAHHQDDQIETFFINLNRQAGIKGLKSIPIKRDHIIRPFIAFNSGEIRNYLLENNISHREDTSNSSNKYARNLWRNTLLPNIADKHPKFSTNVIGSIQKLQQEDEILTWLMGEKIDQLTMDENGSFSINKELLATYPHGAVFLYRILDKYGFNYSQCEQMMSNASSSGAYYFSQSHQLLVDRKSFIVQLQKTSNHTSVEIASSGIFRLDGNTLHIKETTEVRFSSDPNEETVSIAEELFPITLRYWQEGDRIQPLGMKGSKLLSDFFIDAKVDGIAKKQVPLLCKGQEVLWVCGIRISEKLRHLKSQKAYLLRKTQ